jgi:hypothetical protein
MLSAGYGGREFGLYAKEGIMAGRRDYCRYEPNLEELLDDEMMESVLRSAGFDSHGFREMITETARRLDYVGALTARSTSLDRSHLVGEEAAQRRRAITLIRWAVGLEIVDVDLAPVCIGHPGSLRSAVELLVLRHLLVGTHIERRALVGKQPAAEGKIVAERVAHEIHGVEVPVLEIHRMHLVALRPVYDASDLGPDRRPLEMTPSSTRMCKMLSHSIRLTWPSGSGPGIPPSSVIRVSKSQCRMRRSGAEADRSGVGILQMKDLTFTMSPVAINVLKLWDDFREIAAHHLEHLRCGAGAQSMAGGAAIRDG